MLVVPASGSYESRDGVGRGEDACEYEGFREAGVDEALHVLVLEVLGVEVGDVLEVFVEGVEVGVASPVAGGVAVFDGPGLAVVGVGGVWVAEVLGVHGVIVSWTFRFCMEAQVCTGPTVGFFLGREVSLLGVACFALTHEDELVVEWHDSVPGDFFPALIAVLVLRERVFDLFFDDAFEI